MATGSCPDGCNCSDNDTSVTCIQTDLAEMPILLSPRLKSLTLRFNNINFIGQSSLMFYTKLVMIDLSHNKIVAVQDSSFTRSFNLKKLNLEGNKISKVTNETFAGLSKLQTLSLRKNEIVSLPAGAFSSNVPSLVDLDLSGNRITEIGAFHGLTSLSLLNLADNLLPAVPSEALSSLPHLAELYLSGNLLKALPNSAFSHFLNLATLEISSSLISTVHVDAFKGLSNTLKKLKLADNDLKEIPADAFYGLPKLHVLDIGRNPFQVIPRGAFSYLKKLKKIDLSGCGNLVRIENGAFAQCIDLEHIVISQNRKLIEVERNTFDAVPSLRTANFEDNRLPFLPEALLPWNHLKKLELSGNPWSCGECEMILFLSSINARNPELIANNGGKCASSNNVLAEAFTIAADDKRARCAEKTDNVIDLSGERGTQGTDLVRRSNSLAVTVSLCVVTVVLFAVFIAVAIRFKPMIVKCCGETRWRYTRTHAAGGRVIAAAAANDRLDTKNEDYQDPSRMQFASVATSTSTESSSYSPARPSSDEEHYYYVTTMNNREMCARGKHIPVTEL